MTIEYLGLLIFCLTASSFFSGSETSLFSLSSLKIEDIKNKHPFSGKIIIKLLQKPQKLLVAILISNTFVNILATLIIIRIFHQSHLISLFISAFLILIFGEVTPKTIAIKLAPTISIFVAPFMYILTIILTPFVFIFRNISNTLVNINSFLFFKKNKEPKKFHSDAVIDIIKESEKTGVLNKEEVNILGNLIKFSDSEINKILKPRNEMFSISINTPLDKLPQLIKEKKYSRIPVWEEEEENIIGILEVKNLIKIRSKKRKLSYYRNILSKPLFIPDSTKAKQLLKNFQDTQNRISIVIDEYGGILGLITLEDVLEEIIGDIIDKDDIVPLYYKYNTNVIEVQAKIEINEFNKVFKTNIKSKDSSTIGGYILEEIKRIPKTGEIFKINNLIFRISNALPNKIESITVTKITRKEKEKKFKI